MQITFSKDRTEYSSQIDLEQALNIGKGLVPTSINDTLAKVFCPWLRL